MKLFDDNLPNLDMASQPIQRAPAAVQKTVLAPDETLITAAYSWLEANDPDVIIQQDVWAGLGMPDHAWTAAHGARIIDALIRSGRWFHTGRWRRRAASGC